MTRGNRNSGRTGESRRPADSPLTDGRPWRTEIDSIESQIQRTKTGKLAPEKFKAFRLWHGIYGQRQPDIQMIRVRIPNGVLRSRQLEALAGVAENHGNGIAHVTTRQDVQFYFIPLEETLAVLNRLAEADLMTRGAGGNSVRNVTSCPYSGVCRGEPFPVLPYAQAVARFLLRHPAAQLLGRKFKIALSGCPDDCAAGAIHDIGAIAQIRGEDAATRRGFLIKAGGGLGATPYVAQVLEDFVPAEQILRVCEALVRLFSLHGDRRNRVKARSKFIVDRLGIEKFRETYRQLFQTIYQSDRRSLEVETYLRPDELSLLRESWPEPDARPPPEEPPAWDGDGEEAASAPSYGAWLRCNTTAQRQPGLRAVTVPLLLGDIRPRGLRRIAALIDTYAGGEIRTTIEQNLLIRDVPVRRLPELYRDLQDAGLADAKAGTALDVTSCPGTDTCNLGITSSRGVARAITRELEESRVPLPELQRFRIKVSGCPNGCGHHHVAGIGLHGVARRVGKDQAPYYQLHLGGRLNGADDRVAKGSLKIPAKRAPQVVRRILERYLRERRNGEELPDFLHRSDPEEVRSWLGDLLDVRSPDADPGFFTDWEREERFSTAGLREGECAGAGVDLSIDPFDEVVVGIRESRFFLRQGLLGDAVAEINRALLAAGRIVLLDGLGKKTRTDWETICEFRSRLVDRGHASEGWNELRDAIDQLLSYEEVREDELVRTIDRVESFLEESRMLLASIIRWKEDPSREKLAGLLPRSRRPRDEEHA